MPDTILRSHGYGRLITDGTFMICSILFSDGIDEVYDPSRPDPWPLALSGDDLAVITVEAQNVWCGVDLNLWSAEVDLPDGDWETTATVDVKYREEAEVNTIGQLYQFDGTIGDFKVPPGSYRLRAVARGREACDTSALRSGNRPIRRSWSSRSVSTCGRTNPAESAHRGSALGSVFRVLTLGESGDRFEPATSQ